MAGEMVLDQKHAAEAEPLCFDDIGDEVAITVAVAGGAAARCPRAAEKAELHGRPLASE